MLKIIKPQVDQLINYKSLANKAIHYSAIVPSATTSNQDLTNTSAPCPNRNRNTRVLLAQLNACGKHDRLQSVSSIQAVQGAELIKGGAA